jgi:hypothetical protein
MRLAIVAASTYKECGQLPILPNAEVDIEALGWRLAEPDAGWTVHVFTAARGLAEGIEQLIETAPEPIESVLVAFSGYTVLSEERGPALLLDGPRLSTLSIARLKRILTERTPQSLVMLDTVTEAGTSAAPLDVVRALGGTLVAGGVPISVLCATRPQNGSSAIGPSAFAGLIQTVIDWQTGKPEGLYGLELYEAMRAEEVLFTDIPAAGYFPAPTDFRVLPPALPVVPSRVPPGSAPSSPRPAEASEPDDQTPTPTLRVLAPDDYERVASETAQALKQLGPAANLNTPEVQRLLAECRSLLRAQPRDPKNYRRLVEFSQRFGLTDTAWSAASCLEQLGDADINESLLASAHKPEGLLPARGSLDDKAWTSGLFYPERDVATRNLLGVLLEAATEIGLTNARRKKRGQELDPEQAQDPAKSTTTLAKTLLWTSKLLGIATPALYVLPEVEGGLAVAPERSQILLAGRALGSGLSLPELAFLWGRKLALLRPEHRLVVLFPELEELADLVKAGLATASSKELRALDGDAKRFAGSLKRAFRGSAIDRLRDVAREFPKSETTRRMASWTRSVVLCAGRAGLLACGNIEIAARLSKRYPFGKLVPPEAVVDDLLAYSVSNEYAELRNKLGVAVRG